MAVWVRAALGHGVLLHLVQVADGVHQAWLIGRGVTEEAVQPEHGHVDLHVAPEAIGIMAIAVFRALQLRRRILAGLVDTWRGYWQAADDDLGGHVIDELGSVLEVHVWFSVFIKYRILILDFLKYWVFSELFSEF